MTLSPSLIWEGRAIGDPASAALTGVEVPTDVRHPQHPAWMHFRKRVRERIGGDVDPAAVWCALVVAIRTERDDLVRCLGRLTRTGRRLWEFRVQDGRVFYAVFDHGPFVPVTVLTPRQLREGRSSGTRRLSRRAIE